MRNQHHSILVAVFLVTAALPTFGQDAARGRRNDVVKRLPPPGREIPPADRADLEAGVANLGKEIDALRTSVERDPARLALLPDVKVYFNAVRYPLTFNEPLDVAAARAALAEGMKRAAALRERKPAWVNVSGPRGYVSRIDGSVQPYVLILPDGFNADDNQPRRLDFFCHGRDENLTELKFISARTPASAGGDRFLVNLYGRYCNANKFAGEIDLLEALESVKRRYTVDEDRVVVTGFSMGGAACWHFAVHDADLFAAASPGAGFAETRRYLKLPNGGADAPWYERALWHWYDCPDYAANLSNLPTVAYAGELDPQKQASDVMEEAMRAEGLTLERLIGPGTKHEYHKETKKELDRRLSAYAAKGRDPVPPKVRFTTWTLRYNRMHWVTVDAMERHWVRARVEAEIAGGTIRATTQNVSAVSFHLPEARNPLPAGAKPTLVVDNVRLRGPVVMQGRPWSVRLEKGGSDWKVIEGESTNAPLAKRHGLQGPIDDAFLDRFLFVLPTGRPLNEKVGRWAAAESDRAISQWRALFRGVPLVKRDADVTDDDIASSNLVLWGDPSSNRLLARLADKLPVRWTQDEIQVGDSRFPSATHVPLLIYPNPLNPRRYVVLNSGFTFREEANASNARQVPKLPDYAVLDVTVPPDARSPGRVVKAGFFGERWELLPDDGRDAVDPGR